MKIINLLEVNRFILVGGLATFLDFIFYSLFNELNLLSLSNSKRLSFFIAANFAFILNKNYVFKSPDKRVIKYIKYILLISISFILNSIAHDLVFYICKLKILSFIIAAGLSTVTNFLGQKYFVFK